LKYEGRPKNRYHSSGYLYIDLFIDLTTNRLQKSDRSENKLHEISITTFETASGEFLLHQISLTAGIEVHHFTVNDRLQIYHLRLLFFVGLVAQLVRALNS
jgi:hypothetical protein